MAKGKLIVLEGPDGAGTTSQAGMIWEKIVGRIGSLNGVPAVRTQEPSDGDIGQLIRKMLRKEVPPVGRREMTHLFMADRVDHVKREIQPNLDNGCHVICDRYYISTLVYQSVVGDLNENRVAMWNIYNEMMACDGQWLAKPDVVIFLDAGLDALRIRRRTRGGEEELFEADGFQAKVVDLYRSWYHEVRYEENKFRVDGEARLEDVFENCWNIVKKVI